MNVAIVAVSLSKTYFAEPTKGDNPLALLFPLVVTGILANLPLFCVIVFYLYKFFRWCYSTVRGVGYVDIQTRGNEMLEESYQGERWEPPNNENFPYPLLSTYNVLCFLVDVYLCAFP